MDFCRLTSRRVVVVWFRNNADVRTPTLNASETGVGHSIASAIAAFSANVFLLRRLRSRRARRDDIMLSDDDEPLLGSHDDSDLIM